MLRQLLAAAIPVATAVTLAPTAGAQRPTILVVPELTHGWGHEMYRDLLRSTNGDIYDDGWLDLAGTTRVGIRLETVSPSGAWGAVASIAVGDAELRSGGDGPTSSFRRVHDAETLVLGIGVFRRFTPGVHAPGLRPLGIQVELAAVALRISAPAEPPVFGQQPPQLPGPLIRDFLSPGVQFGVGLTQPVARRLAVRLRGAYGVVRHDTEGLDGGIVRPGESGEERRARWVTGGEFGFGVELRL